jgi:hypothetical protein
MALPLSDAGVQQIVSEQALLSAMQSTITASGIYLFPKMPPGEDQAAYEQKIASEPCGLLVYPATRNFNVVKLLGGELLSELLQTLLAAYLLSMTHLRTFSARLGFYAVLGAIAAIATNVSYWNWYGFPAAYTGGYMFTTFSGTSVLD